MKNFKKKSRRGEWITMSDPPCRKFKVTDPNSYSQQFIAGAIAGFKDGIEKGLDSIL